MGDNSGRSLAGRATDAGALEPEVSSKAGIPNAKEVVRHMVLCNYRTTAKRLCDHMTADGWSLTYTQLAIQRAIGSGHLLVCDNLDVALPNPAYVSNTPRTDRLGRPLRTIAQAIEAETAKTEGLGAQHESAAIARKAAP